MIHGVDGRLCQRYDACVTKTNAKNYVIELNKDDSNPDNPHRLDTGDVSYISSALYGGNDTIQFVFTRGNNRFWISIGRNGIYYGINSTNIWGK